MCPKCQTHAYARFEIQHYAKIYTSFSRPSEVEWESVLRKTAVLGRTRELGCSFFPNTDLSASQKISRFSAKIQRRTIMVWKGRVREILCCRNFFLLVHVFVTQTLHSPPISPYPTGNTDGKIFFQILSFSLICAAG